MNNFTLNALIILIAIGLCITKYFSTKIAAVLELKHQWQLLSFTGGSMIGLVFLVLLPEVIIHTSTSCNLCFFIIMLGFATFHLMEKYFYQHDTDEIKLATDLKELREIGFFIDHIIIGFVFAASLEIAENFFLELILLSPLLLQVISSSIALEAIEQGSETVLNELFLDSSPLIGAILAIIIEVEFGSGIEILVLSFAVGMTIFIISRDIIPQQARGSSYLFLLGLTLSTFFWLFSLGLN